MDYHLKPGHALQGKISVPADKSISHRALMFAAIATGTSDISGLLESEDCLATASALQALGVSVERISAGQWRVVGKGPTALRTPTHALDLGNAGTAMRLLTGLLAGCNINAVLTGDASLCQRPMQRIITPLEKMGAHINATAKGYAPLHLHTHQGLQAIEYVLPVASAQLKSCLLLAGLNAKGTTTIHEPLATRDHSERLLSQMGAILQREEKIIHLTPSLLQATRITVPADISSAAFFMVGASIAPGSSILLHQVGANPTRTGIIDLLRQMGANITLHHHASYGDEPIADIMVKYAPLHGIDIFPADIPRVIDELPVLARQGQPAFLVLTN